MSVTIMHMFIAATEANRALAAHRKKMKRMSVEELADGTHTDLLEQEAEEVALEHAHAKQMFDLVDWHIGVQDIQWYVKPRSTCWFDEYLFKIYTPDMFYDILRMRRRTFDRLVDDLHPFIQGQATHWRQPIGVE